ncbi:hypothetical protein BCY84_00982 [Trypanosoma cruzi cruzi]|nr:hypothetical protein BCY84_00982 [Trypanosoma cruzi cruzi]
MMCGGMQQQKQQHTCRASWLFKQAEWRFAWDRRFFVQDGLRLAYRVGENEAEKKAGYVISLQRMVEPPESHTFRVWLKEGECWTLRAETEEEHQRWTSSIAAALMQDAAEELHDVREGFVLKKGAWTGQWRQRYLELDEYRLAYRMNKEGEVRNRFVIVSADASGEEGREEELLVSTSCGEQFWLKFASKEQFDDWTGVIMRGLRRTTSWHWRTLVSPQSSEYASVRVQYHASGAGNGPCVYCYGGTYILSSRRYFEASKVFLPDIHRVNVGKQLSCVQLTGEHKCISLDILPYEEGPHAKLRPPPLFGAALCVLRSPSESLSSPVLPNFYASTPPLECLLLVGGRSETSVFRDVTVDVWWCVLQGRSSRWQRCTYDANVLPGRTFHTLTAVSSRSAVLIGGLDSMNRVCADCLLIFWPEDETEAFITPPVVRFFCYLPEPRAFHVCLALRDVLLLLLGGRGVREAAPCSSLFVFLSSESEWRELTVEPPLPVMNHVCAEVVFSSSGEQWVFVLGETCTSYPTLRLFQLSVQSKLAVSREVAITVGDIPRRCCGATMHHAGGYLYLIGGCYDGNQRNDQGQAVLFRDPIRMLIGDSEGGGPVTTHQQ